MHYTTVRTSSTPNKLAALDETRLAVSAVGLLSTCSPLPELDRSDQDARESCVWSRAPGRSPFTVVRTTLPEGPEYDLARRFADELGVKLKITPMRTYAEIYAALNSGQAHLAAAGLKVPMQAHPRHRIRSRVPAGARASDLPARRDPDRARCPKSATGTWKSRPAARTRRPWTRPAIPAGSGVGRERQHQLAGACWTASRTAPSITPSPTRPNSLWRTMRTRTCASLSTSRSIRPLAWASQRPRSRICARYERNISAA